MGPDSIPNTKEDNNNNSSTGTTTTNNTTPPSSLPVSPVSSPPLPSRPPLNSTTPLSTSQVSQNTPSTTPQSGTTSGWFSKLKIPASIKASFDYYGNGTNTTEKEREKYDHLIFLVHGIGPHEEKWKEIIPRVSKSFYKATSYLNANIKVKFIPVEWHAMIHSKTDESVNKVTPKGISNTRSFVNNTLLDILLWAHSPFGQTIYDEVGSKLNKSYSQFLRENPDFAGDVSIYAHSLGSLICYDLLSHQPNMDEHTSATKIVLDGASVIRVDDESLSSPPNSPKEASRTRREGNIAAWKRKNALNRGVDCKPEAPVHILHNITYPVVEFPIENLFMLGSPAGIFMTLSGAGAPVQPPKCNNMFNVYNPSDPVTYLVEPLIDEGFLNLQPALCPHFANKSMKGAVAKSKSIISFYKNYYVKSGSPDDATKESSVNTSVILETSTSTEIGPPGITTPLVAMTSGSINGDVISVNTDIFLENPPATPPNLNGSGGPGKDQFFDGKRFDYRMQPSGIVENISEYASVINAHKCYWGSKDVMLFIVKHLMDNK